MSIPLPFVHMRGLTASVSLSISQTVEILVLNSVGGKAPKFKYHKNENLNLYYKEFKIFLNFDFFLLSWIHVGETEKRRAKKAACFLSLSFSLLTFSESKLLLLLLCQTHTQHLDCSSQD